MPDALTPHADAPCLSVRECEDNNRKAGILRIHTLLLGDEVHNFVVHDENERCAGATEDIREGALEEAARALGLENLGEAVRHGLVDLLLDRLGRLDLEAALHGVERVGNDTGE